MVAGRAVCKRANVAKLARLFATLGLGLGLVAFVGAGCVGFNLQDFLEQPGGQQPATDPVPTGRVPEAVQVTTLLINDAQVTADVHVLYLIQDQTVHEAYLALVASPGPGNTVLVGPDEAAVVVVEGTFAAPSNEPLHKTAAETQSFGPLIYQAGIDFNDGDVLEIHLDLSEPPEREPPNEPPSITLTHPTGPLYVQLCRILTITWQDFDDHGTAAIDIWYSDSPVLGQGQTEGKINQAPIDQATGPDQIDLDTCLLDIGQWYIHAIIDDGSYQGSSVGGPIQIVYEPYGQMRIADLWDYERLLVEADQSGAHIGALAAGDVNDDWNDDLIIGAGDYGDHGRTFVLYGGYSPDPPLVTADQIVDPLGNYIEPVAPAAQAGRIAHDVACLRIRSEAVARITNELSADQGTHVLIGSPDATIIDPDGTGEAVVEADFAITDVLPVPYGDVNFSAVGFAVLGTGMSSAMGVGRTVASADITDDWNDEALIGAPDGDNGFVFAALQYSTQPPLMVDLPNDCMTFAIEPLGPCVGAKLGSAIAGNFDVDDDWVVDCALGAPGADITEATIDSGSVWVLSADQYYYPGQVGLLSQATRSPQSLADQPTRHPNGVIVGPSPPVKQWRIDGAASGDQFGYALAVGDLEGDESPDDLVVGAPGAGGGAGKVYVLNGTEQGGLGEQTLPVAAATIASSGMGFEFVGPAGGEVGAAVAVTDLNDDWKDDIVIGAPGSYGGAGAIYVIYGHTLPTLPSIVNLTQVGASLPGLLIVGQPGEQLGGDLTGLGWFDAGHSTDIAAAARNADVDGAGPGTDHGRVYLLFGLMITYGDD